MLSLLHIVDECGRWAVTVADASVMVPQRRLGVTGIDKSVRFSSILNPAERKV